MDNSIIVGRYTKALIMVGDENKCLDRLKTDMELLSYTINQHVEFARILENPIIKPSDKIKVMHQLFEKRVHRLTINFIDLLIKNKREGMLSAIVHRFIDMYEIHHGIKRAHITSAIALDDEDKVALQKRLNKLYHADIKITTETDPELIGGFVLRIGDHQFDASIASGLKRMKKALIEN